MSVEARQLRDAMGCFATGITVISTRKQDGEAIGMTVNSFNSVSLDPPLILFSIDRKASNFQDLRTAGHYAVNILSAAQKEISMCFAEPGRNGFADIIATDGLHALPIIPGSLAVFECRAEAQHDGGDHVIFVGRVLNIQQSGEAGDPLLYFRGAYAGVTTA